MPLIRALPVTVRALVGFVVPMPTEDAIIIPDEILTVPKVLTPETLSCCDVKLVADVIPKVLIPETLSCCDVRFVVLVIPKVLIPETLSCLVNNVDPVIVVIPANVEIPETLSC
jgi:hypothetical protein